MWVGLPGVTAYRATKRLRSSRRNSHLAPTRTDIEINLISIGFFIAVALGIIPVIHMVITNLDVITCVKATFEEYAKCPQPNNKYN